MDLKINFSEYINHNNENNILDKINENVINYCLDKFILDQKIFPYFHRNGFWIENKQLIFENNKNNIRNLHKVAVEAMRKKYKKKLKPIEKKLLEYIANGYEIKPNKIKPKIILVDSRHELWNLFNYIKIHWSIPISSGYGKRLTYLIFDSTTNKIMGILGLCDPVFSIKSRDNYIGWKKLDKQQNLNMILDGFLIGAVPPYNMILGGKLIASLLFSNQIREDYKKKYQGTKSFIKERENTGELIMISTLSALGKSSIYDRIKLPNGQKFIKCGFSNGYGEFQFHGSLYNEIFSFVSKYYLPSQKIKEWGSGFRNKREVIHKFLKSIEKPQSFLRHNINREQFIIPLCKNYKQVLIQNEEPNYYDISIEEINEFMKRRWIIPRTKRDKRYLEWKKENYSLWI
ncbi:MAG: DUF4338 domain-containing protein [Candidatus Lokiarchaeota archaeon]|nr:DUF4338 domain-containing protein [Candidatus Lokiarchaeota archaeon]